MKKASPDFFQTQVLAQALDQPRYCYTYNKNIGYISNRAWVGIGIAYQRKESGIKGTTTLERELKLKKVNDSLFLFFLPVPSIFSVLISTLSQTAFFLHFYIKNMTEIN